MVNFVGKRVCGRTVEGFGEYRTTWNDYEYRCPECGYWSKGSDVTQLVEVRNDGVEDHAILCPTCAATALASGEFTFPAVA